MYPKIGLGMNALGQHISVFEQVVKAPVDNSCFVVATRQQCWGIAMAELLSGNMSLTLNPYYQCAR